MVARTAPPPSARGFARWGGVHGSSGTGRGTARPIVVLVSDCSILDLPFGSSRRGLATSCDCWRDIRRVRRVGVVVRGCLKRSPGFHGHPHRRSRVYRWVDAQPGRGGGPSRITGCDCFLGSCSVPCTWISPGGGLRSLLPGGQSVGCRLRCMCVADKPRRARASCRVRLLL